jgi:hypothetical protein
MVTIPPFSVVLHFPPGGPPGAYDSKSSHRSAFPHAWPPASAVPLPESNPAWLPELDVKHADAANPAARRPMQTRRSVRDGTGREGEKEKAVGIFNTLRLSFSPSLPVSPLFMIANRAL